MKHQVPQKVLDVLQKLEFSKFEALLVGGCVRDLLMGREVKDWDIATNAKPEEVQKIFPNSFYENEFGTVGVKIEKDSKTEVVEVTTCRLEEKYTDKRHPDSVKFTSKLEDDLARRDFTINAMAIKIQNSKIKNQNDFKVIDPFGGQADLENKIVRAVGKPEERFSEDALRLMRAVRFAAQLGFEIEPKTKQAIVSKANLLKAISRERVRDELIKIVASLDPAGGIVLMQQTGLLKIVLPELEEGIGVAQNKHHIYTVFDHSVKSLAFAAKYNYNIFVRLAVFLHDIGKPRTKQGEGPEATFHGHEVIGAKMAVKALERLHFPKDFIEKVYILVRYHMFYYNVGEVTAKSVRRLVRKVGPENIGELLELRQAERKGSGVPKAEPYRLRHLKYMIEKVSRDPLSVSMLAADGNDVIKELGIAPGPRVGYILGALLEEVIDEPKLNTREYLLERMRQLHEFDDAELAKLARAGQEKLEGEEEKIDESIKGKYYVK